MMEIDLNKLRIRLCELVGEMLSERIEESQFETPLQELGVDSLMALELAVHLEREFGIRLSEEELSTILNINSIMALARERMS